MGGYHEPCWGRPLGHSVWPFSLVVNVRTLVADLQVLALEFLATARVLVRFCAQFLQPGLVESWDCQLTSWGVRLVSSFRVRGVLFRLRWVSAVPVRPVSLVACLGPADLLLARQVALVASPFSAVRPMCCRWAYVMRVH
jgi:hypothetical protein